jgi:hypothetical protein
LCETCEGLTPHDPQHVFLKIRQALSCGGRSNAIPLLPAFDYAVQLKQSTIHEKLEANPATETATPSPQPSSPSSPHRQQRQQAVAASHLSAKFVEDVTIPDGFEMQPSRRFVKTWKVKNNGQVRWPEGCILIFTGGDILRPYPSQIQHNGLIPSLSPGEEAELDVELSAPEVPGHHISYFRIISPDGIRFGDRLWCDINVVSSFSFASVTSSGSGIIQDLSDSSSRNIILTTPTELSVCTISTTTTSSSHGGSTDYGDQNDDNSSNPWISEPLSIGSQTETLSNQHPPGYVSVTSDTSAPNEELKSPLSAASQDYEWVNDDDLKYADELARLHKLVSGNTNPKSNRTY